MQKLSLFVLFLGFTFCFGQYQPLNLAEAAASSEIQNLIQFGLQAIEQDATQRGFINDTNFTLDTIYNVSEEVGVGNGTNYRFNVSFTNPNGEEIYARFTIHVDNSSNNVTLLFRSYTINYPNQPNNTIQIVPIPRAREALLFGVRELLLAGRRKGNVPPGNYILTQAANNSVQVLSNNVTGYTFSVALNNTHAAAFVTANFTVDYNPKNHTLRLFSFSLRSVREIPLTAPNASSLNSTAPNLTTANNTAVVVPLPVSNATNNTTAQAANITQAANNTQTANNTQAANITSPIFVVPANNSENVTVLPNNANATAPVNNTLQSANVTNVTNFAPIPMAVIAQDPFYHTIAKLGAQKLIPVGIQSGQIPNVTYNAVQILGIGQAAVPGGQLYQVQELLLSPDNVTANLTFDVLEKRPANQLLLINEFSFNSA